MTTLLDPKDGGYRSRKMLMAYVVMSLCGLAYLACARWPALAAVYAELCMALLGASSIYVGGDIGHKWLITRNASGSTEQLDETETAPETATAPAKKAEAAGSKAITED